MSGQVAIKGYWRDVLGWQADERVGVRREPWPREGRPASLIDQPSCHTCVVSFDGESFSPMVVQVSFPLDRREVGPSREDRNELLATDLLRYKWRGS